MPRDCDAAMAREALGDLADILVDLADLLEMTDFLPALPVALAAGFLAALLEADFLAADLLCAASADDQPAVLSARPKPTTQTHLAITFNNKFKAYPLGATIMNAL